MNPNENISQNSIIGFSPNFEPTVRLIQYRQQILEHNILTGIDMDFDPLPPGLEKYGHEIDTLPYMGRITFSHDRSNFSHV